MIGSIVGSITSTMLGEDKNYPWHEASEFLRANIATGQALDQPYAKAHDCEGCGAPLQRLAHHCEYCGRQK